MSVVYVTSDWHLGHVNAVKWRTGFEGKSIYFHDELILQNYLQRIKKRDIVWFLGDVIFDPKYLQRFKDLPGSKRLILGNHDTERAISIKELVDVFDDIHSMVSKGGAWLSHAPIHPDELRNKFNIHGHCHDHKIADSRYANVCLEHTHFSPVPLETVLKKLREKNAS